MALAENNSQGGYLRDVNFSMAGDDYSNPSASSYASQANPYRTGDYYTVSGRSNTGLSLGKIIVYSCLGFAGYWLYKRMKRG
jgi:hypothetical protein